MAGRERHQGEKIAGAAVPLLSRGTLSLSGIDERFGMLLEVRPGEKMSRRILVGLLGIVLALPAASRTLQGSQGLEVAASIAKLLVKPQATANAESDSANRQTALGGQAPVSNPPQAIPSPQPPRVGLSIVVLDPAHGGTDLGARGTEGIRESDVVLQFAVQVKKALEAQGFQVSQTRDGNDNPSFDDRSARANAQRGAIFITLHVASTGLAGTVRVYVPPEIPPVDHSNGLIPWDRAQGPYVALSRKLGDLVQAELAKRFKGSPTAAQVAPVRQLRTTAAPAIAVEISSVSVGDRADLDRMVSGVADAITRGVLAFKLSYVVPTIASPSGGTQP
jgi:N-acetylmuramoyl-L-alanine amidase